MSAAESEPAEAVHPTDLSLFQQEILYVLATGGRDYGLGIKDSLEDRYGEAVNHGRLYPNLDDLVDDGLIEMEALDKRTNEYFLTQAGKRLIRRDAQYRHGAADSLNIRGGE